MLSSPEIMTNPLPPPGQIGLAAERQHVSTIVYAVPGERVCGLLPAPFEAALLPVGRRRLALLSVTSFLDRRDQVRHGRDAFEQTNYRLHVRLKGEPCCWLLGVSLGSLSAVAPRHLWPLPWHLSAMEFQVSYDPARCRYCVYHLQSHSQWSTARWEIEDTGAPAEVDRVLPSLTSPSPLGPQTLTDYFLRKDGRLGAHRVCLARGPWTRGRLKSEGCTFLSRLGLLTRDEWRHPYLVALRPNLTCQISIPQILNWPEPALSVAQAAGGHERLALAS